MSGVVPEAAPQPGGAVGRIVIPKAEVDWIVVEGITPEDLRKGPGHIRGSAMPGQVGNTVISGHRTTNGAPFYNLDRLERGDTISVETSAPCFPSPREPICANRNGSRRHPLLARNMVKDWRP